LANAIKFTPAGGTIELSLAQKAGDAVVTVRDSGVGFDEQFADKLFEPFTQEEQGPDRRVGGLGLGLAIASRLAKLQDASLSAASAELIRERRSPLGFRSQIDRMSVSGLILGKL
jgi:signal transduction histidine kinase